MADQLAVNVAQIASLEQGVKISDRNFKDITASNTATLIQLQVSHEAQLLAALADAAARYHPIYNRYFSLHIGLI